MHLIDPPTESSRLLGLDLLAEPALSDAIARAGRSLAPQLLLPVATCWAGRQRRGW